MTRFILAIILMAAVAIIIGAVSAVLDIMREIQQDIRNEFNDH